MLDRNLLAKIHVAKKQLAMEDDAYRAVLESVAGKRSAKDLTVREAEAVLAHMQKCGFRPTAPKARRAAASDRDALIRKLGAQLKAAGRDWPYLERAGEGRTSMVRRICGVDSVSFCDAAMLRKLVAALAYDAKRHANA
ncbi:hypothetical protein LMG10661_01698 [Ralstonia syzygii subsp. syzygii]|nr:hypothetical protein LMG10661_01698 [Ralstonia syzygii subsp. syzygii]